MNPQALHPDADGVRRHVETRLAISRQDAKSAGLIRYFTGLPCMRGHIADRHVSNTRCVECHRLKATDTRSADPVRISRRELIASLQQPYRENIVTRQQAISDGLKRYFTGLACGKGHIAPRLVCDHSCTICALEKGAKQRAANPEIFRARVAKSYQKHINTRRSNGREQAKKRYELRAEEFRQKSREKRSSDPVAAFTHRARQLVRAAMFRSGFRKAKKTEVLLGCTLANFRAHIERQFLPGMHWANQHLWEIDHIVPVSTATSVDEAESLNKASNLRPLWRDDNRSKSAKRTHLL